MRNERVLEMTVIAMFIGLIVVMATIPYIGFLITGTGFDITTVHVPVIIGTLYGGLRFGQSQKHAGLKYGLIFGFTFGLFSLIMAFMLGAVLFQNPFVAIVPRVLFGATIWYIFKGLQMLTSNKYVYVPLTFLFATLAHTIITISAIILSAGFYREMLGDFANILIAVMPVNGVIEIALAVVIGGGVLVRLMASDAMQAPTDET